MWQTIKSKKLNPKKRRRFYFTLACGHVVDGLHEDHEIWCLTCKPK